MLDIYIINIKERTDRWEHISNSFGKNFNLIRIDAIKNKNGQIGCFLSHKKCVQFAKDNKLKNIIVMEDDCEPYCDNFVDRLICIKQYLDNNDDWNIFLGGVFHTSSYHIINKVDIQNENLFEITNGYCAHFIIYNHTCYDLFLSADETQCPIDLYWQEKITALIPIPFIATQKSSFSDIINKHDDTYRKRIKLTNKRLVNYLNVEKSKDQ
jgi:glycosyl transferase family 25